MCIRDRFLFSPTIRPRLDMTNENDNSVFTKPEGFCLSAVCFTCKDYTIDEIEIFWFYLNIPYLKAILIGVVVFVGHPQLLFEI